MNSIELAKQAEEYAARLINQRRRQMTDKELWEKSQIWDMADDGRGKLKRLESVEKFAELVRADERRFIAERWEKWYGHDVHGVAEFVRKRANTQGEQDEHH